MSIGCYSVTLSNFIQSSLYLVDALVIYIKTYSQILRLRYLGAAYDGLQSDTLQWAYHIYKSLFIGIQQLFQILFNENDVVVWKYVCTKRNTPLYYFVSYAVPLHLQVISSKFNRVIEYQTKHRCKQTFSYCYMPFR